MTEKTKYIAPTTKARRFFYAPVLFPEINMPVMSGANLFFLDMLNE